MITKKTPEAKEKLSRWYRILYIGRVKRMHDKGMSLSEIAKKLNKPESTIRKYYVMVIENDMKRNKLETIK